MELHFTQLCIATQRATKNFGRQNENYREHSDSAGAKGKATGGPFKKGLLRQVPLTPEGAKDKAVPAAAEAEAMAKVVDVHPGPKTGSYQNVLTLPQQTLSKPQKSLSHRVSSPNTYGDQINDILKPIKNLNLANKKSQVTGGRLAAFHSNWCQITNDKWILNTIHGYAIEWIQKPDQSHRYGNPKMSQTQTEMIDLEVETLLKKRCNRIISKHIRSVHKSPNLKTKKRWHNETCVQYKENEQKCEVRTFQNGGNASSNRTC